MAATVYLSSKACTKCGELKEISAFPKQRTYCKKCWYLQCRPAMDKWAAKNHDKTRAYTKKWQKLNPEKVKEKKTSYLQNNREKVNAYSRDYRSRKSEVVKAHDAVKYALKIGKIKKEPCFCCGDEAVAHHPSYAEDMRISVVWLCPQHHAEVHA